MSKWKNRNELLTGERLLILIACSDAGEAGGRLWLSIFSAALDGLSLSVRWFTGSALLVVAFASDGLPCSALSYESSFA